MEGTTPPGSENGEVVITYQDSADHDYADTVLHATVTYGEEQAEVLVVAVTAPDGGTPTGTVTVKSGSASVCTIGIVAPTGSCELKSAAFPAGTVHLAGLPTAAAAPIQHVGFCRSNCDRFWGDIENRAVVVGYQGDRRAREG